jgi:hypothetical protein
MCKLRKGQGRGGALRDANSCQSYRVAQMFVDADDDRPIDKEGMKPFDKLRCETKQE